MEAVVVLLNGSSRLLLVVAALLILYRFSLGPSIFDRVAAIEALALSVVGYLLLQSNSTGGRLFIDAALGLALFSFAGTVFLAYFLGRGEFPDE